MITHNGVLYPIDGNALTAISGQTQWGLQIWQSTLVMEATDTDLSKLYSDKRGDWVRAWRDPLEDRGRQDAKVAEEQQVRHKRLALRKIAEIVTSGPTLENQQQLNGLYEAYPEFRNLSEDELRWEIRQPLHDAERGGFVDPIILRQEQDNTTALEIERLKGRIKSLEKELNEANRRWKETVPDLWQTETQLQTLQDQATRYKNLSDEAEKRERKAMDALSSSQSELNAVKIEVETLRQQLASYLGQPFVYDLTSMIEEKQELIEKNERLYSTLTAMSKTIVRVNNMAGKAANFFALPSELVDSMTQRKMLSAMPDSVREKIYNTFIAIADKTSYPNASDDSSPWLISLGEADGSNPIELKPIKLEPFKRNRFPAQVEFRPVVKGPVPTSRHIKMANTMGEDEANDAERYLENIDEAEREEKRRKDEEARKPIRKEGPYQQRLIDDMVWNPVPGSSKRAREEVSSLTLQAPVDPHVQQTPLNQTPRPLAFNSTEQSRYNSQLAMDYFS